MGAAFVGAAFVGAALAAIHISVPEREEQLNDVRIQMIQRLVTERGTHRDIAKLVVIDHEVIECQVHCALVQETRAVREELVGDRKLDRLAGQWTEFFVAPAKVGGFGSRE